MTILRRYLVSQKTCWRIKTYLLNHKISEDFKPKGAHLTPNRASKWFKWLTISPEQCSVEDLINKHECGVINGRVLDVTWLAKQCEIDGEMLPPTRTLAHILNDMGYQQIENRRVFVKKNKLTHYMYGLNHRKNRQRFCKSEVIDFLKWTRRSAVW